MLLSMTTLPHAEHAVRRKAYSPHYMPSNLALFQVELQDLCLKVVDVSTLGGSAILGGLSNHSRFSVARPVARPSTALTSSAISWSTLSARLCLAASQGLSTTGQRTYRTPSPPLCMTSLRGGSWSV